MVCLLLYLSVCHSIGLSVALLVCLLLYWPVCHSIGLSAALFVTLLLYLSVCQSIFLVCLCASLSLRTNPPMIGNTKQSTTTLTVGVSLSWLFNQVNSMNQSQTLEQYISQLVGMPVTLSVSQSDKKSFSVFQPANKYVRISAKQSAS